MIDGKKLVFVPILRAGTGLLDGFLAVVPARASATLPVSRPGHAAAGRVLLQMPAACRSASRRAGPMLATGNSAVLASRD